MQFAFLQRFLKGEEQENDAEKKEQSTKFYSPEELLGPFLIVFVLVVLLLVSCLAVVMSAFEYRTLFHQHQQLVQQRDELQVEWGQLLLEQSAWAANNRVEQQAEKRLEMVVPEVNQIEVIRNER
jgi:cell division protein FtsL